jgi:lipooligosaccharide transport system ATP-binding protein
MRSPEPLRIIVKAQNLTKVFNDVVAVDNISFSVFKEECFGLLGPNGAGKTTTVRMASCFVEPTSGRLEVLDHDVLDKPRLIKARLGVCPQEANLDPDLTVEDNLRVFARYFDMTGPGVRKRCEELLHFVGLFPKRKSAVDELSGGMKRRLMIARSLINQPDLLILDEPTTGLDPQARHQVWESIIRLKKSGTTVLLTTHYMEEAAHLCDRVVIMDQGKIVVSDSPKELVRRHAGSHVIEITPVTRELEEYLKGKSCAYEKTATHVFIYSEDGPGQFIEISEKFSSDTCTLRMANLEDVFLKLTGRELRE